MDFVDPSAKANVLAIGFNGLGAACDVGIRESPPFKCEGLALCRTSLASRNVDGFAGWVVGSEDVGVAFETGGG
jgi:hypothetical protein